MTDNIIFIGTSHISPDSIKNVRETIIKKQPDIVAIELKRIIIRLGGISCPRAPPAIMAPTDILLSYPCFNSSGKAMSPIVTVAAALTPDIAPNIVQITTVPLANPPRNGPLHL